ncbi:MAG: MBL fold metallo-hydrolase [Deltaproteobacteria bacterium]|nr:MBL fold metallo-hydrolase [Deltaproteobacteria bacterium]
MRFTVLGSGSKGNALVVEGAGVRVLVDAGLGPRVFRDRLGATGLCDLRPRALFVTHGHSDHVGHAPEVAESYNIPTHATDACAAERAAAGAPLFAHRALPTGAEVRIGSLCVRAFATPHDAPGSAGLVFEDGESRLGIVTDLGCVPDHVTAALRDVDLLYVESNHDVEMLRNGPYPAFLKRRCLSNVGHLSNEQCAILLGRARGSRLRTVVLAHLSEANNTPQAALRVARRLLDGSGVALHVAPQREALPTLEVRKARPARPPEPVYELATVGARPRRTGGARGGLGAGPQAQMDLFGFK